MTKEQKFENRLTEMGLLAEWENIGRLGRVATTDANGNIILFVHEGDTDAYSEIHYPPFEELRTKYGFIKNCILEWKGYDAMFECKLDAWLGGVEDSPCPLDPVDAYFPASAFQTFYVDFEDDQRDVHAAVLKRFLEESALGETRPLPFGEPVFGEPLFMTNIQREAVLVHFGTCGDWTRAVLIPSEELDDNDRVEDALDWFMHD